MAVTAWNQLKESGATWKINQKSYHFSWDAISNSDSDTPDVIGYAFVNVFLGGNYYWAGTFLNTITIKQKQPRVWQLDATFETMTAQQIAQRTTEPVDRPAYVTTDVRVVNVPAIFDQSGTLIVNKAGEPFKDTVMRRGQAVITVLKNYYNYDEQVAATYRFTTNSNTMWAYGPGELLCTGIKGTPKTEILNQSGVDVKYDFWEVVFTFEENKLFSWNWQLAVANAGLKQLDGGVKTPVWVDTTKKSIESTEPMYLDADGKQLTTGATPGDDQILKFTVYPQSDFSSLNLTT